jgi:ribosomal protein S18 acetylase RimI-like enzyme
VSVVVRRVRPEEYAAVAALTLEGYVDGGFIAAESAYVAELADTARRDDEAEVLVAVSDGVLVGAVTWCPAGSSWREVAANDEGEFRTLVVSATARGRGAGEALVRACLARAADAGFSGVALCSMPAMADAQRLYQRLGFSRAFELDWSPHADVSLQAFRLRF